jgi:hypothetical protein
LSGLGFQYRPDKKNEPTPPAQARTGQHLSGPRAIEVVMSTTWEQLEGAALSLARAGPIKDRLTDAYRNHLAFVNVEDLPDALRAPFRACHDALTREPPLRGEDAVRATVRKLSNHEADELGLNVVRLFTAIAREAALHGAASDIPRAEAASMNGNGMSGGGMNGNGGGRAKAPKPAPQVIPLYAAEA